MNPHQISTIERTLLNCFSESELTLEAEKLGLTQRHRDMEFLPLIISLLTCLGGDGCSTYLADLHRKFNEMTGLNISYRSWMNQVKKTNLPALVLWLWLRCLKELSRKVMAFGHNSPFAEFQNIWIHDGSSQAVYSALKEAFPGRFNKVSPAAVELHTTMDLLEDNVVRVQLTEDTRSERACLPALPVSLAYVLILMDAGYFELEYFCAIDDREGNFLCKAPQSINPVIHEALREDGKKHNRYKGEKLKDVLSSFPKDQCMDLDVEWPSWKGRIFRLVVRWNGEKGKWVFIITNLERIEFSLSEVLQAYRLRWQIELLFKEVKSYGGWHRFNTKSMTLVFSLILLSFVVATLKRYLAHAAQSDIEVEISTHKVAKSGTHLFGNVMAALMRHGLNLDVYLDQLVRFWQSNGLREHPVRDNSSGRSRLGLLSLGGA